MIEVVIFDSFSDRWFFDVVPKLIYALTWLDPARFVDLILVLG